MKDPDCRKNLIGMSLSNENILNLTVEGILVLDTEGNHVFINRAAANMLGYDTKELLGRPSHSIWHHTKSDGYAYPKENCPIYASLETGKINSSTNEVFWRKDGSNFLADYVSTPILKDDQPLGVVITFTDITERRAKELLLEKLQKLESLGVLADGIAHDFNNLLAAIMGNSSLAMRPKLSGEQRSELFAEIICATKRAVRLTHQLHTYTKGGCSVLKNIQLDDLIKESASFILGKSSKSICQFRIAQNLWMVNADIGQLAQVIQNLTLNACQAMPEGGIITLEAFNETDPENLEPGQYVHIKVKDTGIGIPHDCLDKIFEPYFSTKDKDGTNCGLGLAIVHRIIERHKGFIIVDSLPNQGTTFHIYLPAVLEHSIDDVSQQTNIGFERKLKILVMDDEQCIQNMLQRMLTVMGHESVITNNGLEAINAYTSAFQTVRPFDLVILDLTIPGSLDGQKTLSKLSEIDPKLIAIASSGYHEIKPNGFKASLFKPYQLSDLRMAIEEVMK